MKLVELRQAIRQADPAAVLVTPAVMNRVIQQVCNLPTLVWEIPHRSQFVIDRRVLFRHVEQDDLEVAGLDLARTRRSIAGRANLVAGSLQYLANRVAERWVVLDNEDSTHSG